MALDEASGAKTRVDLDRVIGSLRAYRAGSYPNFEEDRVDPATFYGADTYRRLGALKAAVDPNELFGQTTRSRRRAKADP